ncbi:putative tumor necrosis factor receptor superfamily member 6-like [Apostichopus japonicus]|uniref:Putative tumor necrosis factor receptor superfamily member 6-like n=1 Tax=Stichopus japonicus TaxID=307972 RepID=A0A2G8KDR4_STIJA|nr:putative tumor necrosis factor receptor superfamily member 6-like [Apostichopus japonicus]
MMALNLFFTAYAVKLLAGIDPVFAIFEDHPCAAGQFKILGKNAETFIRCQTCYMCPPGYGVLQECTETSDTTCKRCPSGYFSDSSTRRGGCKKCRPCLDEEDTVRECTSNSNRECRHQCSPGDYLDEVTRRCLPCSLCHQTRNVRVTTNEQCSSQGLPDMWVCSSNITVTDDEGHISTFDTGDVYSYKAVSRRKHQGGQTFHSNYFPPLEEFISDLEKGTPVPSETSAMMNFNTATSDKRNPRAFSSVATSTSTLKDSGPLVTEASNAYPKEMLSAASSKTKLISQLVPVIVSCICLVVIFLQQCKIRKLKNGASPRYTSQVSLSLKNFICE